MAKADHAVDDESADVPRGPVEARSLSAITGIASNPPAYPRNPTQKKLEPLALYIVRVPGSKGRLEFLGHAIPGTDSACFLH